MRAESPHQYTEPLLDYIPRVTPRWVRPDWMAPYAALIELALREPIRCVVAAPPQHAKTETTIHGLVRSFRVKPKGRSAYATYNAKRCASVERKARAVAARDGLGVEFRQGDWYDPNTGGAIIWASRNGGLTGEPVDTLLVIDDIIKDRKEANSETIRDECVAWFDDVADPRCHPSASIIVMGTRWHPDDLSGVLIKRGWDYLNLKAIADGPVDEYGHVVDDPLHRRPGEVLCEDRKTLAELERKRHENIYSFASLYQGEPRPKGGTVFLEPTYYRISELPKEGYRVGYGVDLAYTEKTRADWSVCLEGWFVPSKVKGERGKLYLVGLDRKQVDPTSFVLTLVARRNRRRGRMRWYLSGTEKGGASFIKQKITDFEAKPASVDKLIRSTPAQEAWNGADILVPYYDEDEPDDAREWRRLTGDVPEWAHDFAERVTRFTGLPGGVDDDVDALAALWDLMASGAIAGKRHRPAGGSAWS